MKDRLLLQIITFKPRGARKTGYTMMAGMLVILALLVGTLGLVAIVNGGNLATFFSGQASESDQVAEAGADLIINTFNQPQNRKLLVAGSTPPKGWSTSNQNLQSPCLSSMGARPGTEGTGLPSSKAINISDGNIRNLENPESFDGDRRFSLVAVRYSTGTSGSSNRRSISTTFKIKNKSDQPYKQSGNLNGSNFEQLVNLDSSSNNIGSIAVTVEGRLYKTGTDTLISTSTITKEYEVVPKCCGGSFGSNGSSGTTNTTSSTPSNSLGADPRYCSIDYGLIVGINGGRLHSFQVGARFNTVNALTGKAEPIKSILGIVERNATGTNNPWDRAAIDTTTTSPTTGIIMQAGCRTEPSACNDNTDAPELGNTGYTDKNYYYGNMYNTLINTVKPNATTGTPYTCFQIGGIYGNSPSYEGKAATCTPIVPLYLSNGLPRINPSYTYNWLPGSNPDNVSKQANFTTTSQQYYNATATRYGEAITALGYPSFNATQYDEAQFRLRVNPYKKDVNGNPMLEYCNTKLLPNKECVSSDKDRGSNTWAQISSSSDSSGQDNDYPPGGISDDFHTGTLDGWTVGSSPRWPTPWEVWDPGSPFGLMPTNVKFMPGSVTFENPSNADWTSCSSCNVWQNVHSIARAFNFYALKDPFLVIDFKMSGNSNDTSYMRKAALYLDYGVTNNYNKYELGPIWHGSGYYWLNVTTLFGTVSPTNSNANTNCYEKTSSLNTFRCEIYLPFDTYLYNPNSHYVRLRLRATNNFGTNPGQISSLSLTKVSVTSRQGKDIARNLPWCQYSSTFPITNTFTGGFHCLGPTISLGGTSSMNAGFNDILYVDTSYDQLSQTNTSISFYYNNTTDTRHSWSSGGPIGLQYGGSIINVACQEINDNCITPVSETKFNPPGQYTSFNIFGRDTPPASGCKEAGRSNQGCMQMITIVTNACASADFNLRSRLTGAWLYLPWGYLYIFGRGESSDSWCDNINSGNFLFSGRAWVRSLRVYGFTPLHFAPSASSDFAIRVGAAADSDQSTYIGWTGIDWVARAATSTRKGVSLLD